MIAKFTRNQTSFFILLIILIVATVSQTQNAFQFPFYQDNEGTNISKAWALMETGQLSPYTYAYDEPPAGSFLLGLWMKIAGSFSDFPSSVDTGRMLMIVMHVGTLALMYGVVRKMTQSDFAAVISTGIFAFSPLAVGLQRRVLLDNIMIVWLLMSLYLVLGQKRTLKHYILSGILFALAALTKSSAVFFLPAFIYIVQTQANPHHKRFAISLWLALAIMLVLLYPLYAQMKQELFPEGWLLGGNFPHVSLFESITDRGPDTGRFLNIGSGLGSSFRSWVDLSSAMADPIIIYGGIISSLFIILMSIQNRKLRPLIAMIAAHALYFLLGGLIFNTDVITLLPFFAMSIGILIARFGHFILRNMKEPLLKYSLFILVTGVLLYPAIVFYSNRLEVYTLNQVDGQLTALNWIKDNVQPDAVVITDNYAFVDLRQTHPNTHHYWRVDTDPAVKFAILQDDVCNIDYVITTPQIQTDTDLFNLDLIQRALNNSQVLVELTNNGWPVEIRQVNKENCAAELPGNMDNSTNSSRDDLSRSS